MREASRLYLVSELLRIFNLLSEYTGCLRQLDLGPLCKTSIPTSTVTSNTISGNREPGGPVDFEVYNAAVKERDIVIKALEEARIELKEKRRRLQLERVEFEEEKRIHRKQVEVLQRQLSKWLLE